MAVSGWWRQCVMRNKIVVSQWMEPDVTDYQLGEWFIEPTRNRIRRPEQENLLEPLAMKVLAHLLATPNTVVSSDELLDKFWANRSAEPGMVARCIAQIRAALGDSATNPVYIETIRKRGYRLIAPVQVMDRLAEQSTDSSLNAAQQTSPFPKERPASQTMRVTSFALLALASMVALGTWFYSQQQTKQFTPPPSAHKSVTRTHLNLEHWIGRNTVNSGNPASSIAIANTGDQVTFIALDENRQRSLHLRQLDRFENIKLEGTQGALNPFFSHDGEWIGYFDNYVMKRVSVNGGTPSIITDLNSDAWGASWGHDDKIVYAGVANGLQMISATGGTPEFLTQLDVSAAEYSHRLPQHIGDRNAVLFTVRAKKREVWVLDLSTRERRYLFDGFAPKFVEPGYLVFAKVTAFQRASLWAVAFDPESLAVRGTPIPIQDGIESYNAFAISEAGVTVYQPLQGKRVGELLLFEPDGKQTKLDSGPNFAGPRFSNDSTTIVVSAELNGKQPELRLYDIVTGTWQKITDNGRYPIWTPDDKGLTFTRFGEGLFHLRLNDNEPPNRLIQFDHAIFALEWIDNGSNLMYIQPPVGGGDVRAFTLMPGNKPIALDKRILGMSDLTKDQKWIATCRWPRGLFVARFPNIGATTELEHGGCSPRWANSDTQLYYFEANFLWAVDVKLGERAEFGKRRMIADFGSPAFNYSLFDVTDNGRIVVAKTINSDPQPAALLTNWQENIASN